MCANETGRRISKLSSCHFNHEVRDNVMIPTHAQLDIFDFRNSTIYHEVFWGSLKNENKVEEAFWGTINSQVDHQK